MNPFDILPQLMADGTQFSLSPGSQSPSLMGVELQYGPTVSGIVNIGQTQHVVTFNMPFPRARVACHVFVPVMRIEIEKDAIYGVAHIMGSNVRKRLLVEDA